MVVLKIMLLGSLLSWNVEARSPLQSVWSCSIPCVSPARPEKVYPTIITGYCGTIVLSHAMLREVSALCGEVHKEEGLIAVKRAHSGALAANCTTSANPCPQQGIVKTGFSCKVLCPEESSLPIKVSVCARHSFEAWHFASRQCTGARVPEHIPFIQVCEPTGQSLCE